MKFLYITCFFTLLSTCLMVRADSLSKTGKPDPLMESTNDWLASQGMEGKFLYKHEYFKTFYKCMVKKFESHPDQCVHGIVAYEDIFPETPEGLSEFYTQVEKNITDFCATDCQKPFEQAVLAFRNECVQELNESIKNNSTLNVNVNELFEKIMALGNNSISYFRGKTCLLDSPITKTLCGVHFLNFAKKYSLLDKPPQMHLSYIHNYVFGLGGLKSMYRSFDATKFADIDKTEICTKCNLKWHQLTEEYFAKTLLPIDIVADPSSVPDKIEFHKVFVSKVNSFCGANALNDTIGQFDYSTLPATSLTSQNITQKEENHLENASSSLRLTSAVFGLIPILLLA